jgi:NhaP-type Na+/H+ or K+/H+ antiporter
MSQWNLVVVGAAVLVWALVSGRMKGSFLTAAMFFTAVGLIAGEEGLGWFDTGSPGVLSAFTSGALALVLFTDAAELDRKRLRRDPSGPIRLLSIGLPLTIAFGTGAALLIFDGVGLWPAAILATILAPTDAALGGPTVTDPHVPGRIRMALNVESGLNDGLCVPLVAIFLALAQAEEDVTGRSAFRIIAEEIGWGVAAGVVVGGIAAVLLVQAVRRGWVEPSGRQIALLAVPVAAFGSAAALHGSGFLAAFVAGMTMRRLAGDELPTPHLVENVGEVLAGTTFLIFGAIALGPALGELSWRVALYAVLSLTVVRMVSVAMAYVGTGARPVTLTFVGWFGPRWPRSSSRSTSSRTRASGRLAPSSSPWPSRSASRCSSTEPARPPERRPTDGGSPSTRGDRRSWSTSTTSEAQMPRTCAFFAANSSSVRIPWSWRAASCCSSATSSTGAAAGAGAGAAACWASYCCAAYCSCSWSAKRGGGGPARAGGAPPPPHDRGPGHASDQSASAAHRHHGELLEGLKVTVRIR